MTLFREQAVNAQQTKWLGDIVLVRPISFAFLTAVAVAFGAIICAFLIWGSYTKHSNVVGQLIPDAGLIKVYVPQSGIVTERRVKEGQQVKEGDVLYVLSSERFSSALGETQAAISRQVKQRQDSLSEEIRQTSLLQDEERRNLIHGIETLKNELSTLSGQLAGQRSRVALSQKTFDRYQGLMREDYISREQVQQKQEDMLEQKGRVETLERDRIRVKRELSNRQSDLNGLSLRHQSQLAQIDRMLIGAGQELVESEAKRHIFITAPQSGVATAVIAEAGQSVDARRPLVSIVPDGAKLQAELYVPSRSIGFIRAGDKVLIRYQAYPYQKFGHHYGVVESVAKTALSQNDLSAEGSLGGSNNSESMYRVIVVLESQDVTTYGQPQPLQAGMLLDADIQQEKRQLYEWVLEPLYSLTGKL